MSESNARCINYIQGALQFSDPPVRWFFAFGTLLYFIRDFRLGKKFNGDFDICMFAEEVNPETLKASFEEHGFIIYSTVVNDVTGFPFQIVFTHPKLDISVDVYLMVKAGGCYWHTLDVKIERPRNGVLSEYVFKGVNQAAFDGAILKYTWEEIAPKVNFPEKYGTLLDLWYPGWFIPDSRFGQSRYEKSLVVSNCVKLKEKLDGC